MKFSSQLPSRHTLHCSPSRSRHRLEHPSLFQTPILLSPHCRHPHRHPLCQYTRPIPPRTMAQRTQVLLQTHLAHRYHLLWIPTYPQRRGTSGTLRSSPRCHHRLLHPRTRHPRGEVAQNGQRNHPAHLLGQCHLWRSCRARRRNHPQI